MPSISSASSTTTGSARSSGTPPRTMGALAESAARLLTDLGVPRAHVCGLSMGGMVAQELALRPARRVRGLILGRTTPGGPFAPRLGPGRLLDRPRDPVRARHPRPLLFSSEFRREHPERVRELLRHFKPHRSSPKTIAPRRSPAPASTPRCGSGACARDARDAREHDRLSPRPRSCRGTHPRRRARRRPRRPGMPTLVEAPAGVARSPARMARAAGIAVDGWHCSRLARNRSAGGDVYPTAWPTQAGRSKGDTMKARRTSGRRRAARRLLAGAVLAAGAFAATSVPANAAVTATFSAGTLSVFGDSARQLDHHQPRRGGQDPGERRRGRPSPAARRRSPTPR